MDWNLNQNSWNLTGFKPEAITNSNLDSFDSRSASFADHRTSGDFSIDLKLGRVGYSYDEAINLWKQSGPVSKMESSSSSSSSPSVSAKRARATNNGAQVAYCLVDGCNADLSNCKDYHKRHKVCEFHSKSPQVTIAGHKQRFCQQCSRFHSLEEFDEGKRSCRKRLDGHNRRRRKPQSDLRSHPPSFLSNYKGTQFLPFCNSQVHPSTTVMSPTWRGIVNSEAEAACHYSVLPQMNMASKQSLSFGSSYGSCNNGGKQFPFLQIHNHPALNHQTASPPETSVCQPLARLPLAFSESSTGGNYHVFCDKLTTTTTRRPTQMHDSDCALSLLSLTQTQTFGNHMLQPDSIPLVQHIDPMDSVLVSNGRDPWSPPGNKAPQTLPFNWE